MYEQKLIFSLVQIQFGPPFHQLIYYYFLLGPNCIWTSISSTNILAVTLTSVDCLHKWQIDDHFLKMLYSNQIYYVLYPSVESIEGKTLRLKQQYTLCSAYLQDIIAHFEKRSGKRENWDTLPDKLVVQMNDTQLSLCIPELIRILVDVKGLSWEKALEYY